MATLGMSDCYYYYDYCYDHSDDEGRHSDENVMIDNYHNIHWPMAIKNEALFLFELE